MELVQFDLKTKKRTVVKEKNDTFYHHTLSYDFTGEPFDFLSQYIYRDDIRRLDNLDKRLISDPCSQTM